MVNNPCQQIARVALALTLGASSLASSSEEAQCEALTAFNNREICYYSGQLQLAVTLPYRQHSEKGFRHLTTYRVGGIALRQAIAINTSVQKTPSVDQPEMVSALPSPEDAHIRLRRVAARTVAAVSDSGGASSGTTRSDNDQVQAAQVTKGTGADSDLMLNQHNTLGEPPLLQRNDIRQELPTPAIDRRARTWTW